MKKVFSLVLVLAMVVMSLSSAVADGIPVERVDVSSFMEKALAPDGITVMPPKGATIVKYFDVVIDEVKDAKVELPRKGKSLVVYRPDTWLEDEVAHFKTWGDAGTAKALLDWNLCEEHKKLIAGSILSNVALTDDDGEWIESAFGTFTQKHVIELFDSAVEFTFDADGDGTEETYWGLRLCFDCNPPRRTATVAKPAESSTDVYEQPSYDDDNGGDEEEEKDYTPKHNPTPAPSSASAPAHNAQQGVIDPDTGATNGQSEGWTVADKNDYPPLP